MQFKEQPINILCLKALRSYRLRTQVICYFFSISLLLLLMVLISNTIQKKMTQEILIDSAKKSFDMTTNFQLLQSQKQFKYLLDHQLEFLTSDLRQLQKIYSLVLKNEFTNSSVRKSKPYMALKRPAFFQNYPDNFSSSMDCYSTFGEGRFDPIQISPFNEQVVKKLDEVYPLILSNQKLLRTFTRTIAFKGNIQTIAYIPCLEYINRNFIPQNRSWYQNMQSQYQINYEKYHTKDTFYEGFAISSLFLNLITQQMQITFSMSLIDFQGDFQGVLVASLFYNNYKLIGKMDFLQNVFLIGYNGELIISNLLYGLDNQQIFYFYNQSLTGFDRNDWIQIQNILKVDNQLESDCSQHFNSLEVRRILCRVNKTSGADTFIQAARMEDIKGIIISFYNAKNLLQYIEKEKNQLSDTIFYHTSLDLMIFTLIFILILLVVYFLITWMLRPLEKIIIFSNNHIQKQNPQQFKEISQEVTILDLKNEGPFQKLFSSIDNLANDKFMIREVILKANSIVYPKNRKNHRQNQSKVQQKQYYIENMKLKKILKFPLVKFKRYVWKQRQKESNDERVKYSSKKKDTLFSFLNQELKC